MPWLHEAKVSATLGLAFCGGGAKRCGDVGYEDEARYRAHVPSQRGHVVSDEDYLCHVDRKKGVQVFATSDQLSSAMYSSTPLRK